MKGFSINTLNQVKEKRSCRMVSNTLVSSRKESLTGKENTFGLMVKFMKGIFNLDLDTVLGFYQIKKGTHTRVVLRMNKPQENAKSIFPLRTSIKDLSLMDNSMVKVH